MLEGTIIMTNNEKKKRKTFKSYSKNLSQFLIDKGVKPIRTGVHYFGIRISEDEGKTWQDFVNIDDAVEKYGGQFSKEDLERLRDESLKKDDVVRQEGSNLIFRKRVRFYKEFLYNDALIEGLKLWKDTKPK